MAAKIPTALYPVSVIGMWRRLGQPNRSDLCALVSLRGGGVGGGE